MSLDPKYYLILAVAIILAIIFIKKVWKLVAIIAAVALLYWYFFHR